jgi:hypothetical protein
MRRKYVEVLMSIGAVGVLLLVLISFDSRVRQEFMDRWQSGPTVELATAGEQARRAVVIAATAVHEQGAAHTQIVMMLVAAGVLVLFMVKTL